MGVPDPARPGADTGLDDPEHLLWNESYEKWRTGRLDRVQDSARVWLGLLTTLLGLLGSVVLFKGGDLVTGVTDNGWFKAFLVILVALVFAAAVLAVVAGGVATWGGLRDIGQRGEPGNTDQDNTQSGQHEAEAGQEPADKKKDMKSRWFAFFMLFTFGSKEYRRALREIPPKASAAKTGQEYWKTYKNKSLDSADRRRAYLHASRGLGVITAALIAALAVLAVIAGTYAPAPADVIVVHGGQSTCTATGDIGTYKGVTQVISVNSC
jgi:hypothetical protein